MVSVVCLAIFMSQACFERTASNVLIENDIARDFRYYTT